MKVKIIEHGLYLTKGMLYDVVKKIIINNVEMLIYIINDKGHLTSYYYPSIYFEDVTLEYRSDIIDGVLK